MPIDNLPENPFDESKKPVSRAELEEALAKTFNDAKTELAARALRQARGQAQIDLLAMGYRENTPEYNAALHDWDIAHNNELPADRNALWALAMSDQELKAKEAKKKRGAK